MHDNEIERQLMIARKRVEEMDKVDGCKDRHPATVMFAIYAGLKNPSSGGIFDALVMLEDITNRKILNQ